MKYEDFFKKLVHLFSPEIAHNLAIFLLKKNFFHFTQEANHPILSSTLWNLHFNNPLGISAGFDKNAEVIIPLSRLGFGFIEVGTVTPLSQAGNPKPRIFRLSEDNAIINHLGFNNKGLDVFVDNLKSFKSSIYFPNTILGINVSYNKLSTDPVEDYKKCIIACAPFCNYFVLNVSSPNTPGLREFQRPENLRTLIRACLKVKNKISRKNKKKNLLLVKIAPDLSPDQCKDIANISLEERIDGLIIANTTIDRPKNLISSFKDEEGGMSGRPLFQTSTKLLARFYSITRGRIPLIGVGGIFSAADAYKKIRAGASLLQIYTGFVYKGPDFINKLNTDLATLLMKDGFKSLSEAIGFDVRK